MRNLPVAIGLAVLLGACAYGQRRGANRSQDFENPPSAKNEAEGKLLAVLDEVRSAGRVHLEVPVTDGRMLRLLAEAIDAKAVVEVGTSTGYSGLWFALALQKTGGKLTTFEMDRGRAAQARKHFQQAGVDRIVTVIEGDAHQNVTQVKGPVDLVFIDADKEGYVDYLNKLLPLVRPGGLILAHNIEMAPAYVKAVNANPELETLYYMPGSGLGITLRKR
jgi:caffeoyl-CoA O-methyltransferase